jgi:hypothetical protein
MPEAYLGRLPAPAHDPGSPQSASGMAGGKHATVAHVTCEHPHREERSGPPQTAWPELK